MAGSKRAAVIGAGLGGLSAAIHLAAQGIAVTVFEKEGTSGGKAGELRMHNCRFDTGPSLLTMPFILERVFSAAGKDMRDYVQLQRLDELTRYFYPDGTRLTAFANAEKFAAEIAAVTTDSADAVRRYLAYCARIYEQSAELFLFTPFRGMSTFITRKAVATLLSLKDIDPFRTMHSANASFFNDPRTIQLFDRYATYNGSNPYQAPATLNIIQHVEYNLGGYISQGGMRAIPDALTRLATELGVAFRYQAPVEQILHRNGTVTGIAAGGRELQFDTVISNADTGSTYAGLLRDARSREAKRYQKSEPSSSALVFYFAVHGAFPEFSTHNIFFSSDYAAEFRELFGTRSVPADPTVYLYISSKVNSADAPAGWENWFVMINTPAMEDELTPEQLTGIRAKMLTAIQRHTGKPIAPCIRGEAYLTPRDIERKTGSRYGSIYGISSNNRNAAFLRQSNKPSAFRNLYFCGGSAHPGGGIPLVLLSGKHAAAEALNNLR